MKLFHRRILNNSVKYGESIALTDAETGEQLSFNEMRRRSFILATFLQKENQIKKGDILLSYMPNNIHYPIIFLAGALLGASQTGVNPEFKPNELAEYIRKTECKCIFTTSELLDNVSQALKGSNFSIYVVGKLGGQLGIDFERILVESNECNFELNADSDVEENDVLLTPLSSGTTGSPKCVCLTHRNFNVQTEILKEAIFDKITRQGGRRSTIAVLPFYHASGFWALCYCLLTGHQTVVMQKFQAPLLLSCIEDYKVDTLNLVPSIITFLLKNDALIREFDLKSVKIVLCGSAPLSREQTQQFLERYTHVTNFIHVAGYGMTEIVALSHLAPLELPLEDKKHMTSCGQLLPKFECKVMDLITNEQIHKPMERGELWLKSECVMKGYLNDPEETRKCLDPNGWYHTGDIVFFDEEQYFYVVDRMKNVIKVNGMQVSPLELENLLLLHENVAEASVIGVQMDGFGEVPRAFVVVKCVGPKVVEELIKFVHSQVAPYKYLRGGLNILPSLPRSAAGKVLKDELRRRSVDPNTSQMSPQSMPSVFENLRIQVNGDQQNESETFL